MAKINTLTAEQQRALVAWHNEWLRIGTATAPADRPRAEAAITEMYRLIGEERPRFLWVDSPATALLGIHILKTLREKRGEEALASLRASLGDSLRDSLGDSLWASLWDSLRDSLGDSLRDSLRASLWDSLGDSLWDSLWASLWDSLRDSLGDSLGDSLRASLWDSLGDSLRDSLGDSLWDSLGDSLRDSLRASLWDSLREAWWGQHESYWVAYYRFPEAHLGVRYEALRSDQLRLWSEVSRSCGWWWPYRGLAVCSERPTRVEMEPTGREVGGMATHRLHSGSGPALKYRDGWSVWAWHGVRVPQDVIEAPEGLTAERIHGEGNAEVRRVMVERMAFERYLAEADAEELGRDDFGTLYRVAPPPGETEPLMLVKVVNATPEPDGSYRDYLIPVDPSAYGGLTAARAAVASTWRIRREGVPPEEWPLAFERPEDYQPVVET